jgi:FtsP/CotA-like multicopper oxidase with cupredoxin domain
VKFALIDVEKANWPVIVLCEMPLIPSLVRGLLSQRQNGEWSNTQDSAYALLARFFNLSIPGVSLWVIGTDGGLLPEPYAVERLLIAPGERYDIMFSLSEELAGTELVLMNEAYDRGHDSGAAEPLQVARIKVDSELMAPAHVLPTAFPTIERLPAGPSAFQLDLAEKSTPNGLVFTVNGAAYPDVPAIFVANNGLRVFEVKNHSEMDHPFHLHGFFFQVLERDGVPEAKASLANKDTIIVPAKTSLKLVSRFDEPGMWMYHCHILEHAELGMMGEIHVE